jgi:chromosome segregation ATPase
LKREIADLRDAQARSDREVAELRAQLAQEVRLLREEQARSGEAMKRVMEELGGLQDGLTRSEERLAGLEVVHEALKRQLVEETGGLRGRQERLARELGEMKQQFTQLGSAQMAQAQREIEEI